MTQANLRTLMQSLPTAGRLEAIYLRPARGVACQAVHAAQAMAGRGLSGDRSASQPARAGASNKRQVTLIQAEHLAVLAAFLHRPTVAAEQLRRNLVVSGINLLAAKSLFKDQVLWLTIGEVKLEITGPCEPCSKMESVLGAGGYQAMRGHGGVTARVLTDGTIYTGDAVQLVTGSASTSQGHLFA